MKPLACSREVRIRVAAWIGVTRGYLNVSDAKKVIAYIRHKQANPPLRLAGVHNRTAFTPA
jgi:hypothetical protein